MTGKSNVWRSTKLSYEIRILVMRDLKIFNLIRNIIWTKKKFIWDECFFSRNIYDTNTSKKYLRDVCFMRKISLKKSNQIFKVKNDIIWDELSNSCAPHKLNVQNLVQLVPSKTFCEDIDDHNDQIKFNSIRFL